MKIPSLFPLLVVATASGQFIPINPTSPEAARLQIHSGESSTFLRVSDPGNHRWMLQSSTDLTNWTDDGPSYRVFNGELTLPLPAPSGTQPKYYRLNSDLAAALPSTKAHALHLPAQPFSYADGILPQHVVDSFSMVDPTPDSGRPTTHGAALGRVLFHDKRLSLDQSVSCASCHQAEHGFADPRPLSVGVGGQLTHRNTMGLTSVRLSPYNRFFRDQRAKTLEQAVLLPIQDPTEMGMTLEQVVQRVSAEPFYGELFTSAFGTPEVNSTRISQALAQFLRSILSSKSKWDVGMASNFANFTQQEKDGMNLFTAKCGACHNDVHSSDGAQNNGLEFPFLDKGVGEIIPGEFTNGLFRMSGMRNVELTAPYMYDGRFQTLEEVVEFYNSGINSTRVLGPSLTPFAKPNSMNLTAAQKASLVAFLKTLTDTTVTTDPRFSDPFRYQAD